MQNKAAKGCIRVLNDTLFPDFTCCPSSPPSSKYAVKRKKRRAYPRTSAACCAVHATLACAWHTLSLFAFGDESYRPPRPPARKLSAAFLCVREVRHAAFILA